MFRSLPCSLVLTFLASLASAEVIDLRGYPYPDNGFSGPWGHVSSASTIEAAQSVVATNSYLTDVGFVAQHGHGSPWSFRVLVTGSRPDAGAVGYTGLGLAPDFSDVRWSSDTITLSSETGKRSFMFAPGVVVTPGETVFLVFDSFGYPITGSGQILSTGLLGNDHYLPGEMLSINSETVNASSLLDFDSHTWNHWASYNYDLAILAAFGNSPTSQVPEPSTWVMLATISLAAGFFLLPRRRSLR